MNDSKDGGASQKYTADQVLSSPNPALNQPPAAHVPDSINDQTANKISKSDKVMIGVTVVIALGTLVSAGAIILQWREMVGGSTDTSAIRTSAQQQAVSADKIRVASERSATAAEGFTTNAALIKDGIDAAVLKLDAQAKATQVAAKAAQSASKTAKEALVSSNRPWVGLIGKVTVSIPEFKGTTNGLMMESHLFYTVKNFGNSPALRSHSWSEPLFEDWGTKSAEAVDLRLKARSDESCRLADLMVSKPTNGPDLIRGEPLFPGLTLDKDESVMYLTPGLRRTISPQFVGCIRYEDEFRIIHHTKFCVMGNDWTNPLTSCPWGQSAD